MIIENYDIGAVKRRYIDDPLIAPQSYALRLIRQSHGF